MLLLLPDAGCASLTAVAYRPQCLCDRRFFAGRKVAMFRMRQIVSVQLA